MRGRRQLLSVLTDTPYFQGRDGDLERRARRWRCRVRKDFMLDPYQWRGRALGADASC